MDMKEHIILLRRSHRNLILVCAAIFLVLVFIESINLNQSLIDLRTMSLVRDNWRGENSWLNSAVGKALSTERDYYLTIGFSEELSKSAYKDLYNESDNPKINGKVNGLWTIRPVAPALFNLTAEKAGEYADFKGNVIRSPRTVREFFDFWNAIEKLPVYTLDWHKLAYRRFKDNDDGDYSEFKIASIELANVDQSVVGANDTTHTTSLHIFYLPDFFDEFVSDDLNSTVFQHFPKNLRNFGKPLWVYSLTDRDKMYIPYNKPFRSGVFDLLLLIPAKVNMSTLPGQDFFVKWMGERVPEVKTWSKGEADKTFSSLASLIDKIEDIDFDTAAHVVQLMQKISESSVTLAGVKIPSSSVYNFGALAIVLVQIFLFIHLSFFSSKVLGNSETIYSEPWAGLYGSVLAKLYTTASICCLPAATCLYLLYRSLTDQVEELSSIANVILTIFSVVAAYRTYLHLNTVSVQFVSD